MREYFGKSAKIYKQFKGKHVFVVPAIRRNIPASRRGELLDVGCGDGYFSTIVREKGYSYYGLDISPDMIARAKSEYPHGNYLVASATNFSSKYNRKFDVVLMNMLFPSFDKKADIVMALKEAKAVLKSRGKIIISTGHPCFNPYMQKGLFGRDDVQTKFAGYFASGTKFLIHKQMDEGPFVFEDYHWKISDYIHSIAKAGLHLISIDECPPDTTLVESQKPIEVERKFPWYMVFVCGTH